MNLPHLNILQGQVLSAAASVGTELGPLPGYHGEYSQNALHSHVNAEVHVRAVETKVAGVI